MDFAFLDKAKEIKKYKSVGIFVDTKQETKYETNGVFRKTINFFWIPFLNSVPRSFQKFIKKTDRKAKETIENRTSHKALEILYQSGHKKSGDRLLTKISKSIWFNVNNSKAVRNRLKLVKKILQEVLEELQERKNEIHVLSIASGSARAVLEAVSTFDFSEKKIFLNFLDKNLQAHDYSENLAKSILGEDTFKKMNTRWLANSASNFPKYFEETKIDIVEVVGLLDYFENKKVEELFSLIYKNLSKGGTLLAANIACNQEEKFITKTIDWPMIYKTPEEFLVLAQKAGFRSDKLKIIYEPLKIHFVLVAQK